MVASGRPTDRELRPNLEIQQGIIDDVIRSALGQPRFCAATNEIGTAQGTNNAVRAGGFSQVDSGMIIATRYGDLEIPEVEDDLIIKSLRRYGEWAQTEIDALARFVRPGNVVIDAGAFVGTHARAFSALVGTNGVVHAFEPQGEAFATLERNAALAPMSNIVPHRLGLGAKNGKAALEHHSAGTNLGATRLRLLGKEGGERTVVVRRLDDVGIDHVDVIKADVEGMELALLRGATGLITRCSPVIFLEINSVQASCGVIEWANKHGFLLYGMLHISFNPGNFRKCPDNMFGIAKECSLLLIHKDRSPAHATTISDLNLCAIETVDDLALLLLHKPQYPTEVLERSTAAASLGTAYLAPGQEERIRALEAALAECVGRGAALVAEIAQSRAALAEADGRAGERAERIRVLEAGLAEAEGRAKERAERIRALTMSTSWRITAPFRWVRRRAPRRKRRPSAEGSLPPEDARSTLTDGLYFSLESLKRRHSRFYGFGWVCHRELEIVQLGLTVKQGGRSRSYAVHYGTPRDDVGREHACAQAGSSGFWMAGRLPGKGRADFSLDAMFANGERCTLPLAPPADQEAAASPRGLTIAGVRFTPHRLRAAIKALKRGDPNLVIRKLKTEIVRPRAEPVTCLLEDLARVLATRGASSDSPQEADQRDAALRSVVQAVDDCRLTRRSFVLIIDHDLGGGANRYRLDRIAHYRRECRPVILLTYQLAQLDYRLLFTDGRNELSFVLDTPFDLVRLLQALPFGEIFLNNVYSFDDPLAFAALLPKLKSVSGASLTIALHDFFPVCPSYTLLDDTGRFCGVPDRARCRECLPRNGGEFSLLLDHTDIDSWRKTWARCIDAADRILCFSNSSAELLRRAYADVNAKLRVEPHPVDYMPARKPHIDPGTALNIGVVGTIGEHKGARIVKQLAARIQERRLPCRITVFGTITFDLPRETATVTGVYCPDDLIDLIERYRANVFLLPSIWPETFSYVTSELIQMDVPLAVFNLGAPAERVSSYKKGLILTETNPDVILDKLMNFHQFLKRPNVEASAQHGATG